MERKRRVVFFYSIWKGRVMVRMDADVLCSYLSFHRGKFEMHSLVWCPSPATSFLLAFRRIVGGSLLLLLLLLLLREVKLCGWWDGMLMRKALCGGERRAVRQKRCACANERTV